MPNPYGITEVDIPGIYGAVSNLRGARIQQMLGERQIRAADAALDRQNRIQAVLAGAFGRQGNRQDGTPTTAPAASASSAPPATPAMPAAPVAPAATAQPQPFRLSPEVSAQLIAIDPEQGGQIVAAFRQMDTARREQAAAANTYLATFAQYLIQIPDANQRMTEIQRRAPDLMAHGITQEQIASFTPDDQSLRFVISQARDIEKLVEEARPRLRDVGGEIIDERALPSGTRENPVVFRSEYIPTPEGLARRPGAGVPPRPLTDADIEALDRGQPAQSGSSDLDNWNAAGRAGLRGPRTFR